MSKSRGGDESVREKGERSRCEVQPDHVSPPKLPESDYKVHLGSVCGYKLHPGSAERAGISLQKLGIVPKEDPCDCTRSSERADASDGTRLMKESVHTTASIAKW